MYIIYARLKSVYISTWCAYRSFEVWNVCIYIYAYEYIYIYMYVNIHIYIYMLACREKNHVSLQESFSK